MTDAAAAYRQILTELRSEPSRTWSLIVTVFGDAIMPRGGVVWLGALVAFCKGLEIGEGVVRTAMSRLTADGWVERSKAGRNSFYSLAERGRAVFGQAAERIYNSKPPPWRGGFTTLILPGAGDDAARALSAAGFGSPAPGVWIAPIGYPVPESAGSALRLSAECDEATRRALAARSWPLDQTAAAYRRFLRRFEALGRSRIEELSDLEAMIARVLLIHGYRRILLRDPMLPAEILPLDWPGDPARRLCAQLYSRLLPGSERWLDAIAVDAAGAPSPATPALASRFGGK